MQLTTPNAVEFLVNTDLANLPLLDEINFRLQFAKDAEHYFNNHVHLGFDEHSTILSQKIEEIIYHNGFSFVGDDQFSSFVATDLNDFYIKLLRRTVSISYFNCLLGDCFDNHYSKERTKLTKISDKAAEKFGKESAKYREIDSVVIQKLETVDKYGNMLMIMIDNVIEFDQECFDMDLRPYFQNPSQLKFPLNVELIRCASFNTLIVDIE